MNNDKKISKKNIKLCIALLIVLVLAGAYQFGYVNYADKEKEVRSQIQILQTEFNDLQVKSLSRAAYESEAESMKQQTRDIMGLYGPVVEEENIIMLLRNMELEADIEFSSASFSDSNLIFSSNNIETELNAGTYVQQRLVNAAYRCTYSGLKKMLDYITEYPNRMNVDSITVSYDRETGNLSGNILLNMYAFIGGDRAYEEPAVGGIGIGMDNIFSTTELPVDSTPNTGN